MGWDNKPSLRHFSLPLLLLYKIYQFFGHQHLTLFGFYYSFWVYFEPSLSFCFIHKDLIFFALLFLNQIITRCL